MAFSHKNWMWTLNGKLVQAVKQNVHLSKTPTKKRNLPGQVTQMSAVYPSSSTASRSEPFCKSSKHFTLPFIDALKFGKICQSESLPTIHQELKKEHRMNEQKVIIVTANC